MRTLVAAFTVVLVGALAFATTGSAKRQEAIKAAWIYVGPHNDNGWSQAHDNGRLAVQKALGSKVKTTYKELVPEGPHVRSSRTGLRLADPHAAAQEL